MNRPRKAAGLPSSSSAAEQQLQALLERERNRAEPLCRHFGQCGGCQLQDVTPERQLQAKRDLVNVMVQQAGLRDAPPVVPHAAEPWMYRNRVRLRVADGAVGYSRRASNEFLPIQECPILAPVLWRTVRALQQGDAHWPAQADGFELFANGDSSAVQLSVLLNATVQTADRDAPAALRTLCDRVQTDVSELAGAGLLVNASPDPTVSRRIREAAKVEIARWGSPELEYHVNGHTHHVSRGAFFQVNRFLTDVMQHLVVDGRSGTLAWDLYAGAGLFSVPLATQFRSVVAVEVGQPAATDLQRALYGCGAHHRVVHSTVSDFLQRHHPLAQPDLVVLDPPRAGLGRDVAAALARVGSQEIVYVSCDLDTFARDARTLVDSGYTLATLHLLDLFPQTFHTETVAVFRR